MNIVKSAPSAPVELRRAAIQWLIDKGIEPSPENLLKEAKKKAFPLYSFFRDTPSELFEQYGRYEVARRIIDTTKIEFTHGGKTIEGRVVEYVRPNGGRGQWATTESIASDPVLRKAYMREIESLMEQAQAKMARMMELMPD